MRVRIMHDFHLLLQKPVILKFRLRLLRSLLMCSSSISNTLSADLNYPERHFCKAPGGSSNLMVKNMSMFQFPSRILSAVRYVLSGLLRTGGYLLDPALYSLRESAISFAPLRRCKRKTFHYGSVEGFEKKEIPIMNANIWMWMLIA